MLYSLHIINILVFWCVFTISWKVTLFCKKSIFSHSLWPRWLKQTSFYRELNALQQSMCIFFCFPSVSSKKIQNIEKYASKREKFWKICRNIFQKFQKHCLWRSTPGLCKWTSIINFVLSLKLLEKIDFLQDPLKAYIFYANSFLYVLQKKSRNKLCLESFFLR